MSNDRGHPFRFDGSGWFQRHLVILIYGLSKTDIAYYSIELDRRVSCFVMVTAKCEEVDRQFDIVTPERTRVRSSFKRYPTALSNSTRTAFTANHHRSYIQFLRVPWYSLRGL